MMHTEQHKFSATAGDCLQIVLSALFAFVGLVVLAAWLAN
jgi:hypothetical protein